MERSKIPMCKRVSQDGFVCDLYRNHYGPHRSQHLIHSWDEEVETEETEEVINNG